MLIIALSMKKRVSFFNGEVLSNVLLIFVLSYPKETLTFAYQSGSISSIGVR